MALEIRPRSLRQIRIAARAPRVLLTATCAVLVALGLHSLLGQTPAPIASVPASSENTSERSRTVAEAFARAYLSWDPKHPDTRIAAVRRFAPGLLDASSATGLVDVRSRQSVLWSNVAEDRPVAGGRRITVVLETTNGLTALVVSTALTSTGEVIITGYPAIVGAPPVAGPPVDPSGDTVDDAALEATVTRAIGNFLARRRGDLAADLRPGSLVIVPEEGLRLRSVDEMTWRSRGREVSVLVRARLPQGGELELGYSVGVVRQAGRWFVSWIGDQQSTSRRSS